MFRSYYRTKLWLSVAAILLIGGCIASIELDRLQNFEKVLARVQMAEVTCWGGGNSDHYIACADAKPHATRRTDLTITYISPADRAEHAGVIRCETSYDETTGYVSGQQIEIMAHRGDPAKIDMRRCKQVTSRS